MGEGQKVIIMLRRVDNRYVTCFSQLLDIQNRDFTAFKGEEDLLQNEHRNICYCRIAVVGEQNNASSNLSHSLHMVATLPVQREYLYAKKYVYIYKIKAWGYISLKNMHCFTFGKSKTNSLYFWPRKLSWLLELNWPATSFPQLRTQLIIALLWS